MESQVIPYMHKSIYDKFDAVRQCSKIQSSYIDVCHRLASKSSLTHKHGCIIVQNGQIVGKGFNTKYRSRSIHAEMAALYDARQHKNWDSNSKSSHLYVVRVGTPNHYSYKYSKPCYQCRLAIQKFRISKVYYSVNVNV